MTQVRARGQRKGSYRARSGLARMDPVNERMDTVKTGSPSAGALDTEPIGVYALTE